MRKFYIIGAVCAGLLMALPVLAQYDESGGTSDYSGSGGTYQYEDTYQTPDYSQNYSAQLYGTDTAQTSYWNNWNDNLFATSPVSNYTSTYDNTDFTTNNNFFTTGWDNITSFFGFNSSPAGALTPAQSSTQSDSGSNATDYIDFPTADPGILAPSQDRTNDNSILQQPVSPDSLSNLQNSLDQEILNQCGTDTTCSNQQRYQLCFTDMDSYQQMKNSPPPEGYSNEQWQYTVGQLIQKRQEQCNQSFPSS